MKDILRDVMKDICSTIFMKPSGLSFEEPPVNLNKYFGMQRRDNVSLLGRRRTLGLKRFKSIGKKKKKVFWGLMGTSGTTVEAGFLLKSKKKSGDQRDQSVFPRHVMVPRSLLVYMILPRLLC